MIFFFLFVSVFVSSLKANGAESEHRDDCTDWRHSTFLFANEIENEQQQTKHAIWHPAVQNRSHSMNSLGLHSIEQWQHKMRVKSINEYK